jgi:hypothetical protein
MRFGVYLKKPSAQGRRQSLLKAKNLSASARLMLVGDYGRLALF